MLKYIILLTPIYVTLFWAMVLNTYNRQRSAPRSFLSKFMGVVCFIFISHYIFFASFPNIYFFIDPFYHYASILVLPMFNIYFRLLTQDKKVTFKHHTRYIAFPTLLFLLYIIGTLCTPINDYKAWIINRGFQSTSHGIQFLKIIHLTFRLTYLTQVIVTVFRNYMLIKIHGFKAMQFYGEIEDGSTHKINALNWLIIITGVVSIILGALGQGYFKNNLLGLGIASVLLSSLFFTIGLLGNQQKELNPGIRLEPEEDSENELKALSITAQQEILQKLLVLFEENKLYLNNKTNITDVAQILGTNRTYISSIINQQFNMNFCCFVNNYRVEELERVVTKHPEYGIEELVEACGFGSVDSLKRAIKANFNLTYSEWKKQKRLETQNIVKRTPKNCFR